MNNNSDVYDIEKATDLAGGNKNLAIELVGMLLEQLTTQKSLIVESLENNDVDSLKQHIHKLHGSSRCCGTTALTIAAEKFETVICKNNCDQFIACNAQLLVEIDRVLMLDTTTL